MAHRKTILQLLVASSTLALLCVNAAHAQTSAEAADADGLAGQVEEVIVTAQKRSESVQEVPTSIVAVSQKRMEQANVASVQGLEKIVPNLRIDALGLSSNFTIRIRGLGAASASATDPSVATYIDGVYVPRPGALVSSFLDVESAEVLRGPQGTLFGRNATVGAISLRTVQPSFAGTSGLIEAEAGNFGSWRVLGAAGGPVTDTFAVRVAALASHTDGFVKNQLDGSRYGESNVLGLRGSGRWEITPKLSWTVRGDFAELDGDGVSLPQVDVSSATATQLAAFSARLGGRVPALRYPPTFTANALFKDPDVSDIQGGLASDLRFETDGGFAIRVINSVRRWRNRQNNDEIVFTPADLLNRDVRYESDSQSHEVQFISPEDEYFGGRLNYVAGVYYFREDYRIRDTWNLGSEFCTFAFSANPARRAACEAGPHEGALPALFDQIAESVAAYGEVNYALTPTVEALFGARYTRDRKDAIFISDPRNAGVDGVLRGAEDATLKIESKKPSWRAGLKWEPRSNVMAFVTYSTGYKAGTFNSAPATTPLDQRRIVDPENATDIQVGVKSTWFNRRAVANATIFQTKLKGFQERAFDGGTFVIRNAGDIRARGVEFEGQALLTRALSVSLAGTYMKSIYTDNTGAPGLPGCTGMPVTCPRVQDLTGRPTTYAPKWQLVFGAEYETEPFAGGYDLTYRLNVNYAGEAYTQPTLDPNALVGGETIFGGNVTLRSPDRSWKVVLFGDNLLNEKYFKSMFTQTLDGNFGVRDPLTGSTLMRGYLGNPRTFGVRLSKTF